MHSRHLIIVVLILIVGIFISVLGQVILEIDTVENKSEVADQSLSATSTLKLSGQLYAIELHGPDRSTTTVPLLHLGEPLQLPVQSKSLSVEYIQIDIPDSYEWEEMVGSRVVVEGSIGGDGKENSKTIFRINAIDLREDLEEPPKDPVLDEEDIVGMVAENARLCGVGTRVTFFLPDNKLISFLSGSEPIEKHVVYGTWSLEGLSSEYKYPFKTEYGNSWSDGYSGPGFYSECATTLHSSADSLHALSRETVDKYFKELTPEVQSEIREYYPSFR